MLYVENDVEASDYLGSQHRRRRQLWCLISSIGVAFIAVLGILAGFRVVEEALDIPKVKPVFPTQYEASLMLHMPYINLTEPIYVHMDEAQGKQKLSYYGGRRSNLGITCRIREKRLLNCIAFPWNRTGSVHL